MIAQAELDEYYVIARDREYKLEYNRKWRKRNRSRRLEECRAYDREWKKNNPDSARCWFLRRDFGITAKQYDAMLQAQDGLCAVCGKPESVKQKGKVQRLSVDHCHKTSKVRGLVCNACNHMLGKAYDNPDVLEAGARYLRENG
jgi:hypothetical protein